MELTPDTAVLVGENGTLTEVPTDILRVGDVVLVGTPVAHPVFSELIRMVELLHPVRFHVPPHAPFAAAIGAARAALSPANE